MLKLIQIGTKTLILLVLTAGILIYDIIYLSYDTLSLQVGYSSQINSTYVQENKYNSNEIHRHVQLGASEYEINGTIFKEGTPEIQSLLLHNLSKLGSTFSYIVWYYTNASCNTDFKCEPDISTGWKDKTSLRISTTKNINKTWSYIYGQQLTVKPKEQYQFVTHMKMNEFATQSHIVLQRFDQSLKTWHQVLQCPTSIEGPLEWQEYDCTITIPENTTKIRPLLKAGWSSKQEKEAVSWFDSLYIKKT